MMKNKKKPEVDISILRDLAAICILTLFFGKTPEAIFRFLKGNFSQYIHTNGLALLIWLNWGAYYLGKWLEALLGPYLEN